MGFLDEISGGAGYAALDAAETQKQYGHIAEQEFLKMFGLSQGVLDPYNQGGLWALEQLIGSTGMTPPPNPATQAQIEGWKNYQSSGIDARKAPGYIGGKNGWQTWDDKENFIAKNRQALEAMLPTGMSVKDVPGWEHWIMDPYPVDKWGNPLDESLWKYPQGQGDTSAPAPTQGILTEGPPSFVDDLSTFQESPWYKLQLDEGIKALESTAAGSGMLSSGNTGKALMQYGSDYAYGKALDVHNTNVNDWINTKLNPLLSILGSGQVAGRQMSNQALNAGKTRADLTKYQGEALASGYLGQAAARQSAASGLMDLAGQIGGAALGGAFGGFGGLGGGGAALGGGNALSSGFSIGNSIGGGAANDYGMKNMFPALEW